MTIHLARRSVLTLSKLLREQNDLQPGAEFMLLHMDGVFILGQSHSYVDALAEHITCALTEQGENLESILAVLREERERSRAKALPDSKPSGM